ncbi:DUF4158 domain-containing protein [Nocardia sp. NPDC003354]
MTDEQAEACGKFAEEPTRRELERFFFLDDVDRDLIALRRTKHHQLGFALQMCTVRYIGRFLPEDPPAVPWPVVEHLAAQLGIEDPSCVKRYTERAKTAYEHAWEIRDAYEYHEYEDPEWSRRFLVETHGADVDTAALWRAVEEVAPRSVVMSAAALVVSLVPEDEGSAEVAMRAAMTNRYATVRPFLALPAGDRGVRPFALHEPAPAPGRPRQGAPPPRGDHRDRARARSRRGAAAPDEGVPHGAATQGRIGCGHRPGVTRQP